MDNEGLEVPQYGCSVAALYYLERNHQGLGNLLIQTGSRPPLKYRRGSVSRTSGRHAELLLPGCEPEESFLFWFDCSFHSMVIDVSAERRPYGYVTPRGSNRISVSGWFPLAGFQVIIIGRF